MAYGSGKYHGDKERGQAVEAEFVATAIAKGYTVEESSVEVDRKDHIDYYITKNSVTKSVDVKSIRGVGIGRDKNEYTWIELQNVNGRHGWVYGNQDMIVFERVDHWLFVDRRTLAIWIDLVVDKTKIVGRFGDPTYAVYSKDTDKSLTSLIRYLDMPTAVLRFSWKKRLTSNIT
tara:strand:+ start:1103 stop:1627 length:525 start_codon:yes stop_codon:yes gene_type:complete